MVLCRQKKTQQTPLCCITGAAQELLTPRVFIWFLDGPICWTGRGP